MSAKPCAKPGTCPTPHLTSTPPQHHQSPTENVIHHDFAWYADPASSLVPFDDRTCSGSVCPSDSCETPPVEPLPPIPPSIPLIPQSPLRPSNPCARHPQGSGFQPPQPDPVPTLRFASPPPYPPQLVPIGRSPIHELVPASPPRYPRQGRCAREIIFLQSRPRRRHRRGAEDRIHCRRVLRDRKCLPGRGNRRARGISEGC